MHRLLSTCSAPVTWQCAIRETEEEVSIKIDENASCAEILMDKRSPHNTYYMVKADAIDMSSTAC